MADYLWQVALLAIGLGGAVLLRRHNHAWAAIAFGAVLAAMLVWPGGDAPEQPAPNVVEKSPGAITQQNSPGANVIPGDRNIVVPGDRNTVIQGDGNTINITVIKQKLVAQDELDRMSLKKDFPGGYRLFWASKATELYSPPDPVGFLPAGTDIDWDTPKLSEITPETITLVTPTVSISGSKSSIHGNRLQFPRRPGLQVVLARISKHGRAYDLAAKVLKNEEDGAILLVGLMPERALTPEEMQSLSDPD